MSGRPDGISRDAQNKDKGLKANGSEELCLTLGDIKKAVDILHCFLFLFLSRPEIALHKNE